MRGDSQLVLSFMTRACKPGKKQLVEMVKEAREVATKLKPTKVHYQHVKREDNQWADWLVRVAHYRQVDGTA